MLLNSWKEIATYLRSGIRTVQRWETLGLPVLRVRSGNRGPVVARTEDLDAWLMARSRKNQQLRPDIRATFTRAASARLKATEELRVLLQSELRIGVMLAQQSMQAKDKSKAKRLTGMARQAYESILRLTLRMNLSGEGQSPQFKKDLDTLKSTLRNLGERL